MSSSEISTNNDGIKDSAEISFCLNGGAAKVYVAMYDIENNLVATLWMNKIAVPGINKITWKSFV